MGLSYLSDEFKLEKDSLVELLLFGGIVELVTKGHYNIVLSSASGHFRTGKLGTEDRASHSFSAIVGFNGKLLRADVKVQTQDNGKTYEGSFLAEEYPSDNISE